MFKLFAGDLKSFHAARYDAAGLLAYWIPYLVAILTTEGSLWEGVTPILYCVGMLGSSVIGGYMSVWSIRPLIAALGACLIAILLGSYGFALGAASTALLAFAIRAYNFRRRLAPHPFSQLDVRFPAFYDTDVRV